MQEGGAKESESTRKTKAGAEIAYLGHFVDDGQMGNLKVYVGLLVLGQICRMPQDSESRDIRTGTGSISKLVSAKFSEPYPPRPFSVYVPKTPNYAP
jgi:hypothetical protein